VVELLVALVQELQVLALVQELQVQEPLVLVSVQLQVQ
jgi:hypothetical protein